jgi:hypothetical protein
VLHRPKRDSCPWLLVEVKGGHRRVEHSARAALLDLLAYRRAFEPALSRCHHYGLGIAFGAQLKPDPTSEIALATPDSVSAALAGFLA